MQLIKIDPLEFQSLETFIDALCQIFRPPVRHPLSRTRPGVTAFRRDHQAFRIRIQRFGNEQLVRFRTVSIGGVDEIDAQLDRAPQDLLPTTFFVSSQVKYSGAIDSQLSPIAPPW